MADFLSKHARSRLMASIPGKNTNPELAVRRLLWATGKRYRIHDKTLPGRPDISNKRLRLAVFIDGCFWHGCPQCYKEPTSNVAFWRSKLRHNLETRRHVEQELLSRGWTVMQFWEHKINSDPQEVTAAISMAM